MLLERLVEHAQYLDLPPAMYGRVEIHWYVDINEKGELLGFIPVTGSAQEGRRQTRGKRHLIPHIIKTSGIQPRLLADNGEYVLGAARNPDNHKRADNAHSQFRELVDECARVTGEPSVHAVSKFLAAWDEGPQTLPKDFNPAHNIMFRVGDQFPVDLPSVREFWANHTAGLTDDPVMNCLVCGEDKPVQHNLPVKIRGVPDGHTAGTSLVSFNAGAFESYGLKRSLNSPICRDCGEKFAHTANALIADEQSRLYVGPTVYLFWSRDPEFFSPVELLRSPEAGDVAQLLADVGAGRDETGGLLKRNQDAATVKEAFLAPMTGRDGAVGVVGEDAFYAVGLSASGGRTVVRQWLETSVGEVKANLAQWFALQRLADRESEEGRPYGVFALAASLYHDANQIPAHLPPLLMGAALHGKRLPPGLLTLAVQRNRSEQGLTRNRATLIKMVLTSQGGDPMDEQLVGLNEEHPSAAYHCGRLLAELENAQYTAIPNIKATITDRYFGSAASAPASVFGSLIRGAQAHLSNLRKGEERKRRAAQAIDRKIGEICVRIGDEFPSTLNLKEQALFSLGYYHQRTAGVAVAKARRKVQDTASASAEREAE